MWLTRHSLQDKWRTKIKGMRCRKLGSLYHFLRAKLLSHCLQKLSVVVIAPVAHCGMLNGFYESGSHRACRQTFGEFWGIRGGLVVLATSKEKHLARVGIRAWGGLLLLAVSKIDTSLHSGGGISAQKVVGNIHESRSEANGTAARTEALSSAHTEDIVLVWEVKPRSGVTGIEQDGKSSAPANPAHNLVKLIIDDGAGNLVVNRKQGFIVAVALISVGVNDL